MDRYIRVTKRGQLILNGKPVSDQKLAAIAESADQLKHNTYLGIILNTIKVAAEEKIRYTAQNMEEVNNNRLIIYVVSEIEKMTQLPIGYKKAVEQKEESLQMGE